MVGNLKTVVCRNVIGAFGVVTYAEPVARVIYGVFGSKEQFVIGIQRQFVPVAYAGKRCARNEFRRYSFAFVGMVRVCGIKFAVRFRVSIVASGFNVQTYTEIAALMITHTEHNFFAHDKVEIFPFAGMFNV